MVAFTEAIAVMPAVGSAVARSTETIRLPTIATATARVLPNLLTLLPFYLDARVSIERTDDRSTSMSCSVLRRNAYARKHCSKKKLQNVFAMAPPSVDGWTSERVIVVPRTGNESPPSEYDARRPIKGAAFAQLPDRRTPGTARCNE